MRYLMLLFFVGAMCDNAMAFHEKLINPDPEQRLEHVVGSSKCQPLGYSSYNTVKILCGEDLIAIIDETDKENLCLIGVVHHHENETIHAWINTAFPEIGECQDLFHEVFSVREMDELLHQGAGLKKSRVRSDKLFI